MIFDIIQLVTLISKETLPMTDCIQERLPFPRCKGRRVEASFSGGDITSNGGVLLLRQADRALRLTERVAQVLIDPRRLASCRHDALAIVRQWLAHPDCR